MDSSNVQFKYSNFYLFKNIYTGRIYIISMEGNQWFTYPQIYIYTVELMSHVIRIFCKGGEGVGNLFELDDSSNYSIFGYISEI